MSAGEFEAFDLTASTPPVRSMTGFAQVRRQTKGGELTISLRSVNHRGLDLHFHQPAELGIFENAIRTALKQHLGRGHVEVRISLQQDVEPESGSYNRQVLSRYLATFQQVCKDFQLDSKPDLNRLLTMPGVLEGVRDAKPLDAGFETELLRALESCIGELNRYREREGRELSEQLEPELAAITRAAEEMERIRANAQPEFHQRLQQRLQDLLGESGVSVNRLVEEAAVLADRSDVQEELVRLKVHTNELRRSIKAGGQIGKRLDFLLQEMNRETNTILSKTSGTGEAGLGITNLGLGIKANIERIREQALNLE